MHIKTKTSIRHSPKKILHKNPFWLWYYSTTRRLRKVFSLNLSFLIFMNNLSVYYRFLFCLWLNLCMYLFWECFYIVNFYSIYSWIFVKGKTLGDVSSLSAARAICSHICFPLKSLRSPSARGDLHPPGDPLAGEGGKWVCLRQTVSYRGPSYNLVNFSNFLTFSRLNLITR